jgi:RNA polymerase subunit RPABC4/transcription elongation factor Spt4
MSCRGCGHNFPRASEVCPSCGRRRSGTKFEMWLKLAAILIGLAALALTVHLFQIQR